MSLGSQTVVADLQVPSFTTIITALALFYITTLITIAHFRNFFQHHLFPSAISALDHPAIITYSQPSSA